MLYPKIIMNNSISLDGALTNFVVNMGLHYQVADTYHPHAQFIGSYTVKKKGLELFINQISGEKKTDFKKPMKSKNPPLPGNHRYKRSFRMIPSYLPTIRAL